MKNKIILVITILFMSGCATMMGDLITDPAQKTFEKISVIDNLNTGEIYVKANSWFVETFNSAESVIEFQDREGGKIMGKYVFEYKEGIYFYRVKQTISVDIQDGKVRLKIYEPLFYAYGDVLNGNYSDNRSYKPLETKAGVDRAKLEWNSLSNSFMGYLKKDTSW